MSGKSKRETAIKKELKKRIKKFERWYKSETNEDNARILVDCLRELKSFLCSYQVTSYLKKEK